jgi:hypothetical protein
MGQKLKWGTALCLNKEEILDDFEEVKNHCPLGPPYSVFSSFPRVVFLRANCGILGST